MPASAVAVRSAGSCSRRRSSRFSESTMPGRAGGMPIEIRVPPPQGVTGTPAPAAATRTPPTSSRVPGNTTASGVRPSST